MENKGCECIDDGPAWDGEICLSCMLNNDKER